MGNQFHRTTVPPPPPADQELPFAGFDELVRMPLEKSDPKSFSAIKGLFLEGTASRNNPFSFLVQRITGKACNEFKAREHWRNIIIHKKDMESKLGRILRIQTAAVDYFSIVSEMDYATFLNQGKEGDTVGENKGREEWIERIYSPTYYLEKLKDEISRAKRYNHALSLIVFDIDSFSRVNDEFGTEFGDSILLFIIKVIKKTIRMVDIIARYDGDCFLVVLPNTNKREAVELADRIRENVATRTNRHPKLKRAITLTLAVGQLGPQDASIDFAKRIESVLIGGKKQSINKVYTL